MTLDEAAKEFEFDCKIRHLSPKTIDNYGKQLRYLQRFLEKEFSISTVEDVKPSHIKRFLSMMDTRHCPYFCSCFLWRKLTKQLLRFYIWVKPASVLSLPGAK